jgi:branched-chain amino acid transport system substrate-binding protein
MGASTRVVVALLLAAAGCSPRKEPEPVWVGHLAPLSGPDRLEGQHARQGAQLAVEDARAAGQTVAGRPLAIRHVDGRADAEAVRAETVRLLAVNRVKALLAGPDGLAGSVVQAARPYGVAVVVPGELADPLPAEGVLVLGARPAARGRALARYASGDLKATRALVVTDGRAPSAAALASAFVAEWPRSTSTAVAEWPWEGEAGHAGLVKRALAWKPNVVVLAAEARDLGKLHGRLRDAGWRGPILHGGGDVGAEALRRAAGGGPDLYLATVYAPEGLTKEGQAFARRYEERFRQPPDLAAVQTYDAARLLFDVLAHAGKADEKRVREELGRRESFESSTGPVTWQDRRPRRRLFVVRLRGDKAEVVQNVAPED